jgi:hypothetical protein
MVQTSFIRRSLLFIYTPKLGVGGLAFVSVTITTSSGGVVLGRLVSGVAGSRSRAVDVACATTTRGVGVLARVVVLYNFGFSIVVGFLFGIAGGRTNVSGTTTAKVSGRFLVRIPDFTTTGGAKVIGALAGDTRDRITRSGLRADVTSATSTG